MNPVITFWGLTFEQVEALKAWADANLGFCAVEPATLHNDGAGVDPLTASETLEDVREDLGAGPTESTADAVTRRLAEVREEERRAAVTFLRGICSDDDRLASRICADLAARIEAGEHVR